MIICSVSSIVVGSGVGWVGVWQGGGGVKQRHLSVPNLLIIILILNNNNNSNNNDNNNNNNTNNIKIKENFINKFLNQFKFTINDQLMKDFARRFTKIKNISCKLLLLKKKH